MLHHALLAVSCSSFSLLFLLLCYLSSLQLDSGKKQKGLLAERIADMEMAAAAGEGDIRRARAELAELEVS
jgi:hypothetical protein